MELDRTSRRRQVGGRSPRRIRGLPEPPVRQRTILHPNPFLQLLNCIDESINDPALVTYATPHPKGGYWVHRILRHFSGYNVTAF